MKHKLRVLFCLFIVFTACRDYTPLPVGHIRIERSETERKEYVFPSFSFEYSSEVRIDSLRYTPKGEIWFNIVYPSYNAVVYCTYLPVTKAALPKALNDSYQMAYSHSLKADAIEQILYNNTARKVSGILYKIEGEVATPAQFFVTDSISHFFRASFYYSTKVTADSVAPVTEFITQDIEQMMSTFSWKNQEKE